LAGEPIVNSAVEGYSTFRRSGIDRLVAGRTIVSKNRKDRMSETGVPEGVEDAAQ
jgi:carbamoyltransferase